MWCATVRLGQFLVAMPMMCMENRGRAVERRTLAG